MSWCLEVMEAAKSLRGFGRRAYMPCSRSGPCSDSRSPQMAWEGGGTSIHAPVKNILRLKNYADGSRTGWGIITRSTRRDICQQRINAKPDLPREEETMKYPCRHLDCAFFQQNNVLVPVLIPPEISRPTPIRWSVGPSPPCSYMNFKNNTGPSVSRCPLAQAHRGAVTSTARSTTLRTRSANAL